MFVFCVNCFHFFFLLLQYTYLAFVKLLQRAFAVFLNKRFLNSKYIFTNEWLEFVLLNRVRIRSKNQ